VVDGASSPAVRSGATLVAASLAVLLVLVAFTTPLATLAGTATDLNAGPGGQPGSSAR
jgi:hypothetical protein